MRADPMQGARLRQMNLKSGAGFIRASTILHTRNKKAALRPLRCSLRVRLYQ
jgi:hypothetical protein